MKNSFIAFILLMFSQVTSQAQTTTCENIVGGLNVESKPNTIDERPLEISEIHYQVFGDRSKVPLILIHGLDSAWQTFSNVTELLTKDFYVIVYDQRGHGLSAEGGMNYKSSLMAQDLLVLINHLGIKRANILGHSMGARTAVQFAATYPERVLSLIVEDMEMHDRSTGSQEKLEKIERVARELREIPRIYPNRAALIEALKPIYGDEAESLSFRRAKQNPDGTFELLFRPDVGLLYGYQGNTENLLTAYERVSAPLLVMRADSKQGTAVSETGLERMKAAQPNGSYVYFENIGHVIHRGDQERFLKVLLGFLNEKG